MPLWGCIVSLIGEVIINFTTNEIKSLQESYQRVIYLSLVNDLSAYSRKARVRGCCGVSVLYAYDIEKMEPVCTEVFPGNSIDASSYPAFIRDNDIRKGIIVADKGFPPGKIRDELRDRPDLHFLTPI